MTYQEIQDFDGRDRLAFRVVCRKCAASGPWGGKIGLEGETQAAEYWNGEVGRDG